MKNLRLLFALSLLLSSILSIGCSGSKPALSKEEQVAESARMDKEVAKGESGL